MDTDERHQTVEHHPAPQPARSQASPRGVGDTLDWRLLALAALLPLLLTILLLELEVPLGKPGTFVYRYSPTEIMPRRLAALPPALVLAALLGVGVWLAFFQRKWHRHAGFFFLTVGCIAGTGWAYFAPPDFRSQHLFNMQSPSHDGAFLTEAYHVHRVGVKDYLHDFPGRAQAPPEEMRGTRVISNPPGTTLLAAGTISLVQRSSLLARCLRVIGVDEELPPAADRLVTVSTGFSFGLLVLWLLAGPPLYWSGRLFFSPPIAAVFAVVCLFSPTTLLFAPGKDPAQLLSVALPLSLWLLAWRRWQSWAAVLAGGAVVLACLVSLVHVWIAAVVFAASAFATPAPQRRRFGVRLGLPTAVGALAAIGGLALFADSNFLATVWSVTRSQAEITRGEDAMPFLWQALGVPLFLLFAGPALWCLGLWLARRRLRDQYARFGLGLLIGASVVMLATIGFTNMETPRLWIPFTPLLLLGGALQLPTFRDPNRKAAMLLTVLVFAQFAVSATQWSLMDVREAETRLLQRDGTGPRFFE